MSPPFVYGVSEQSRIILLAFKIMRSWNLICYDLIVDRCCECTVKAYAVWCDVCVEVILLSQVALACFSFTFFLGVELCLSGKQRTNHWKLLRPSEKVGNKFYVTEAVFFFLFHLNSFKVLSKVKRVVQPSGHVTVTTLRTCHGYVKLPNTSRYKQNKIK